MIGTVSPDFFEALWIVRGIVVIVLVIVIFVVCAENSK